MSAGRYDTTYLDRLLVDRKGESFSELTEADEEVASIATALDAYLRATGRTLRPGRGCGERTGSGRTARGAARMTFDIEVNGRGRLVSVERAAAGTLPSDRRRSGSRGRRGARWQLSDCRCSSTERRLESRRSGRRPRAPPVKCSCSLDGRTVTAMVDGRRTGRASADGGAHARGEQEVVAPMPGRSRPVARCDWRRGRRPSAGRRRRGDEDGKRAAIAEGGSRQGDRRGSRRLGRRWPSARAWLNKRVDPPTSCTNPADHDEPSKTTPEPEPPIRKRRPRWRRLLARAAGTRRRRGGRRDRHLLHRRSGTIAARAVPNAKDRSTCTARCTSDGCRRR